MTDSMNFGPEWLRNLSSDGSTSGASGGGVRHQLSEYRYGREEMLGLYEKGFKPPSSLCNFSALYTEQSLVPLVFNSSSDEERVWPNNRPPPMGPSMRGSRGTSLERGGRVSRGRGSYQPYVRNVAYDAGGWGGNGEQADWSPRKDYNYRSSSVDNWRRNRSEEEDGWRSNNQSRGPPEKWGRSQSWRDGDKEEERVPQERTRSSWHEGPRGHRRVWPDDRDHLPEWATENLGEGGGTFDSTGAYHGSDEEVEQKGATQNMKESPLQKSASQQNISTKQQSPTLPSSKSVTSLSKHMSIGKTDREHLLEKQTDMHGQDELSEKEDPPDEETSDTGACSPMNTSQSNHETDKLDIPPKIVSISNGGSVNINGLVQDPTNRAEEEFDRLQEDLVLKLVVEEELPKPPQLNNMGMVLPTPQPPPNLPPTMVDKWFYQDPQGHLQGPFAATEMADWYKAGYFTSSLLVRRQFDKGFYSLGDLVHACKGNPFLMNAHLLQNDASKLSEQDILQYQYLQAQLALRHAVTARAFNQGEWTGLSTLQQRDHLSQHILAQQIPPDLQYLQQQQQQQQPQPVTNPLMQMINQMQQVNKLPGQAIPDKPPNSMPVQLETIQSLVQQIGGLQSLQPRLQPGIGLPPNIQNENMTSNLSGLHNVLPSSGNMMGIPTGLTAPSLLPGSVPQKPIALESLSSNDNNPINNLLRQFQNKQSQQIDSLWQQNQFANVPNQSAQWQQQPEVPMSMWDIQQPVSPNVPPVAPTSMTPATPSPEDLPIKQKQDLGSGENERTQDILEASTKEEKKKKELDEKQAKKDAEEKRKQEQKKQEMEKKAAEEKRRKEEDRIKKELEKAKKEAEEKRLRELEEKRKQKELRKAAEEDARKKAEEQKKEKEQRELQEMIERTRRIKEAAKAARNEQEAAKTPKAAPWSQPRTNAEPSLAEIQKAEREKRAEQAALLQQQRALQQQQQAQEQSNTEKSTVLQLNWANKPVQPRQVKSLAEIQAEEQERLLKEAAEQRIAQQQKEKEIAATTPVGGIWHGQNLTWANNPSTQWSSAAAGFWDDTPTLKSTNKPSSVSKSNSTSAISAPKQQQQSKPMKVKVKKEESISVKPTSNGPSTEEFTAWCMKALTNLNSSVDVPTFVVFLRDIESAADVKEICRDYLGESPAMHQFVQHFLEKRRSYKPKISAHKDDMCSPAPAITPSMQHADFQEVKGKGKKSKKSKMTKIDNRILGFSVTASQDRINVGARDYVNDL